MKNNKNQKSAVATLPRLAMLNSMAGFGRISTIVSLPVISALGVQVCPIPTSILSNHLDFPVCSRYDYTAHIPDYIQAWKDLELSFDGFYCGYLASVTQMQIVEDFLESFNPPIFLLDPVMGDYGRAYSTITPKHCAYMKKLLSHADIITPNITEACLLTDTPYQDEDWSDRELHNLCQKLSLLCPGSIVITGLFRNGDFANYIWENGNGRIYALPSAGQSRHGTGDLFASILAANALHHKDLFFSVKQAADFVALCIRGSEEMGLPISEGVPFEKYLYKLINS